MIAERFSPAKTIHPQSVPILHDHGKQAGRYPPGARSHRRAPPGPPGPARPPPGHRRATARPPPGHRRAQAGRPPQARHPPVPPPPQQQRPPPNRPHAPRPIAHIHPRPLDKLPKGVIRHPLGLLRSSSLFRSCTATGWLCNSRHIVTVTRCAPEAVYATMARRGGNRWWRRVRGDAVLVMGMLMSGFGRPRPAWRADPRPCGLAGRGCRCHIATAGVGVTTVARWTALLRRRGHAHGRDLRRWAIGGGIESPVPEHFHREINGTSQAARATVSRC
jgi:hypothetical protein